MNITELTVHELKEKLNKKELTAEEITKAYIQRIEEKEKDVQAFITVLTKEAIKQAKEVDDKREKKVTLAYSGKPFSVPENLYIIGMMNTADRSLAMMDYALRRRFAFFDFAPAFSSEGFKNYLAEKNYPKLESLITVVESLNNTISSDESLGDGFRIGHSYFCTDDEITDEWLKSVVEYEVIPLIKEYWFDEPTKVRDWSATLRSAIK